MIIESIKLHNFGVYLGDNTFTFSKHKPVVLIGGMNGHGKTTFLEAILLGLYGSNSPSYREKKRLTYNNYLKSYINRMCKDRDAFIELTFTLNNIDTYHVRRYWREVGRSVKEELYIKHNGVYDKFLTKNWSMFIENLVPNALSKFFFFDGEKIVEMALDTDNKQVKESIKAMLGINTLDTLTNDLKRIMRKLNLEKVEYDTLNEIYAKQELRDSLVSELNDLNEKKEEMKISIFDQEAKIEQLHNQYTIAGGEALNKRSKLIEEKAKLESDLESLNNVLIEISSTCLPLKMVEDLLLDIKSEAVDEHHTSIMLEAMDILKDKVDEYSYVNDDIDSISKFISYIENDLENDEPFYDLNLQAIQQIEHLIEVGLNDQSKEAKEMIKKKNFILESIKKINSYLEIDINQDEISALLDQIKIEEECLLNKNHLLKQIEISIEQKTTDLNRETSLLGKMTEAYLSEVEMLDDNDRKIKYIHMALKLLKKYKVRLQEQKANELASTITTCYNKLSNKQNLIRVVKIDPATLDLFYFTEDGHEIDRMSLSAGEKQLAVISTLWALAICSKNKLPVIIDTPLARLDSKHRESLVTNYFPFASEQTMILSTDSEIDHNYYDMIKDYIGDEYILEYNEETRSTVVVPGYFSGGMNND